MIIRNEEIPADLRGVTLRDADEAECRAGGMSGAEAIAYSAAGSREAYMVTFDGVPAVFWGYGVPTLLGTTAYGWMLTTRQAEKQKMRLARGSQRVVDYILDRYPRLEIEVHRDHTLSCKWLEWLGFNYVREANGFYRMAIWRA